MIFREMEQFQETDADKALKQNIRCVEPLIAVETGRRTINRSLLCLQISNEVLTVTLHALVDEAIKERATVVTEGGAPISVDLELVLRSGILKRSEDKL